MKTVLWISLMLFLSSCVMDFTNNIYCKRDPAIIKIDSCIAFLPNAFTPNGDGINDVFVLKCNCPVEAYWLVIKSNIGRKLFETTDSRKRWNGTYRSKKITGNVQYEVNITINGQSRSHKGMVSVIRYNDEEDFVLHCDNCAFSDQWDGTGYNYYKSYDHISCQ